MFKVNSKSAECVPPPTEQSLLLNSPRSNNNRCPPCHCQCCTHCNGCQCCSDIIQFIANEPLYQRLVYSMLWWLVAGYLTGLTNAIADNRAPGNDSHLHDLGFDFVSLFINTNNTYVSAYAADICLYICIGSMLVYVLATKSKKEIICIVTRYLVMFDLLFTIRSMGICLTVFPTPPRQKAVQHCDRWSDVFIAPFLMVSGDRMSCHDFFYSGHTTNATISALIVTKYIRRDYRRDGDGNHRRTLKFYVHVFFVIYIWFTVLLVVFFLLVLQDHYTIDCTTAVLLTSLIWNLCENQIELQRGFFYWWHVDIGD